MTAVLALAGAGAAPLRAGVSTTTTLTSSVTSVTQDSWVTFTARVQAARGIATGVVTFTDASNGSILGSARLSKGALTFKTAALAPGNRSIVASYLGDFRFAPSASAALDISVAAEGSASVAYQTNARHDGNQRRGVLRTGSLTKKWTVTLGTLGQGEDGYVSYPVIADGQVFVTVESTGSPGTELYALNAGTGAVEWSAALGGSNGFSALAYDGRKIFSLNYDGILTAFSARTGGKLWAVSLSNTFTAPPTAYDGMIYVAGAGISGFVHGVSEVGGVTWWRYSVPGGKGSPAVDNTGVYVSDACQQDDRFTLAGAHVWYYSARCAGGSGGSTAVLHGSSVYARGSVPADAPVILSKDAGLPTGGFASATAPAFGRKNMYTLQSGKLIAVDPSGSPNRWTFGDGTLVTAPIVSGGTVFVGSSNGTVYGVSASSGAQVWSGVAGTTIAGPDEQNADVLAGMAVGEGLLVVPAANQLTAFGN
jgi:outer membrane protein assembly factor BamB